MISISIPLVIFSLLSTRTILCSTEHLELATHEENTPLSYPPLGNYLWIVKAASETKWYLSRELIMQLKAYFWGLNIATKIKTDVTERHSEKKETVFDAVCFP